MDMIILLRLLGAHLFSDFILQTDKICKGKKENKPVRYKYLAIHSLIQASVSYLFVAQWNNWVIPVVIFITHFIIDWGKSVYDNDKRKLSVFIADQILHIAVICALWIYTTHSITIKMELLESIFRNPHLWYVTIAYLIVLKPTSIFLSLFINRWTPQERVSRSLPDAGKTIGYLERILILTFIFTGNISGVGFLLAAKSIFRFGELNKAEDIKITEYVLIGTFASFTIAIIIAFTTLKLGSF